MNLNQSEVNLFLNKINFTKLENRGGEYFTRQQDNKKSVLDYIVSNF